ncbi:MAG: 2-oxo-hepta-3-ene-1,7-dioic acid hydratase [Pseudomonadota bacterium]
MSVTLTEDQIADAAGMLKEAETSGQQCALVSLLYPNMSLDDAYAVQAAFVDLKRLDGAEQIGWKIGLTSRAMQTPDSGILLSDMLFQTGATVPNGRFIEPRIEAEIAFIMGADLSGADVTRTDVIAATEMVAPSLEILDTRILRKDPASGRPRIIFDTVSDNAANAGVVLGAQRHALDTQSAAALRTVGAIVKRDGVVEETGLGAGVLDDPVSGIVWLVRRLAQYDHGLRAGDIVLSGSFIRPIEAPSGSRFDADFGDFGRVDLDFA